MQKEVSHPEEPSISTTGGFYKESTVLLMEQVAQEFAEKGIRVERRDTQERSDSYILVRVRGEEPYVGLSNFWQRVEELEKQSAKS